MTMDVFDPHLHRIVAIDEKGRHFHLTLPELAMDMSEVDFKPFFARMKELEAMAEAASVPPPAVDLSPLEARLHALETRPDPIALSKAPDLAPVLEAISDLARRLGEVEQAPASPDVGPLLEDLARATDRRHIEQEAKLQAVAQSISDVSARVAAIERAMTDLVLAAQKRLRA